MISKTSSHILLIEDEPTHAELVKRAFEYHEDEFELSVAESLQEARTCIKKAQPAIALVISDWRLPDGEGIDLLLENLSNPPIPVIIMTSYGNEQVAVEAMKAGALDYIVKSESTLADMPHITARALRQWENVTERKRAEEELHRKLKELTVLSTVAALAVEAQDENSLIGSVTEVLHETFFSDNCGILLLDQETGLLQYTSSFFAPSSRANQPPIPLGKGITGEVAASGIPCLVQDTSVEPRYVAVDQPMLSEICVPLKIGARVIGVIDAEAREPGAFTESDLRLLTTLASQLATALERIRAAKALRTSEEKYRELVEKINDVLYILDKNGVITYISPVIEQLLGYQSGEITGHSFTKFIYQEDIAMLSAKLEKNRQGHYKPGDLDFRSVTKSGQICWLRNSSRPVYQDGQFIGMQGILTDITERKLSEQALHESQERFQRLSEAAFEGIGISDEGRIIDSNSRLAEMFGYGLSEVIGTNMLNFVAPESQAIVMKNIEARSEEPYEHLALRKDGTVFPVEVQAKTLPYGGKLLRVVAVRDISQRKHLEEQLRQSQKLQAIGQLAGGIAHDFNNLLTIILSYSDILLNYPSDEPEAMRNEIEQIKEAGKRAAGLTQQLLTFSRKQVVDSRLLDLNDIITGITKMLKRLINEDIELQTVLQAELGRVKADAGQLEQVIMNLVVNARDAMPRGGKLLIETTNIYLDEQYARNHVEVPPGNYVMLAVSDTGTGMDAEVQARIFEPFYTTKEPGKGTGLGLAMVHGIVKQNNGHIWVYSEPGHGTTFKIYLPQIETTESESTVPRTSLASHGGSETILLVEDESLVQRLAREILMRYGYQVLEAKSEEAFKLVQQYPGKIDLLLTDVVMPKMNGRELAENLIDLRPELKVLYMSGYTDNIIVQNGILKQNVAFLPKPFTPGNLVDKVRTLLDS